MWDQVIKVHFQEMFEVIKSVIRSTGQQKKDNNTNNDLNKHYTENYRLSNMNTTNNMGELM